MTQPFICRGDDGQIYFVKGIGAGRESQIKEWVAGNLARAFNIPVAPFKIVSIPEELTAILDSTQSHDLGHGPAFGSLEQRVNELTFTQVPSVPVELRKSVLVFDWWISNLDRMLTDQSGNPNLFWEPNGKGLIVIDHNLAFDPDFNSDDFFKYHAFKDSSPGIVDDLVERQLYTDRMALALDQWPQILDGLPEEWLYRDLEQTMKLDFPVDALLNHLQRFDSGDFWNWK